MVKYQLNVPDRFRFSRYPYKPYYISPFDGGLMYVAPMYHSSIAQQRNVTQGISSQSFTTKDIFPLDGRSTWYYNFTNDLYSPSASGVYTIYNNLDVDLFFKIGGTYSSCYIDPDGVIKPYTSGDVFVAGNQLGLLYRLSKYDMISGMSPGYYSSAVRQILPPNVKNAGIHLLPKDESGTPILFNYEKVINRVYDIYDYTAYTPIVQDSPVPNYFTQSSVLFQGFSPNTVLSGKYYYGNPIDTSGFSGLRWEMHITSGLITNTALYFYLCLLGSDGALNVLFGGQSNSTTLPVDVIVNVTPNGSNINSNGLFFSNNNPGFQLGSVVMPVYQGINNDITFTHKITMS